MIIQGKYGKAHVMTSDINQNSVEQIKNILDQRWTQGSNIAVMPDVHAGKDCVIGLTMTIDQYICPNLISADIGCGVMLVKLGDVDIDFEKLDGIIRKNIPAGMDCHEEGELDDKTTRRADHYMRQLRCVKRIRDWEHVLLQTMTIGGGNHFIEVDEGKDGKYLMIHTGSRGLGAQVAKYYQKLAVERCNTCPKDILNEQIAKIRKELLEANRPEDIPAAIKKLRVELLPDKGLDALAYLTGKDMEDYIHDVRICQKFADFNRMAVANLVTTALFGKELESFEYFTTTHNYLGDDYILRKGSISLRTGETAVIPINMAEGAIIVKGKSNAEYNYSGPHGMGRRYSRTEARKNLDLQAYRDAMKDVWSSCISEDTIDEAPMAYKDPAEVMESIQKTADIVMHLNTLYNYKG